MLLQADARRKEATGTPALAVEELLSSAGSSRRFRKCLRGGRVMNGIDGEVRQRLRGLRLSEVVREEVFAEIAAHLESVAEDLRLAGVDASEADRRALSELGDG